jgi:hypothetical protein
MPDLGSTKASKVAVTRVIDTVAVDPDGLWTVHQKVLPATGQPGNGKILKVDTAKLPGDGKVRRPPGRPAR